MSTTAAGPLEDDAVGLLVDAEVVDPDEAFTVGGLAAHLKISDQMVYALQKSGEIESFRVGKSIRFRRRKVDEWVERQEIAERARIAVRTTP